MTFVITGQPMSGSYRRITPNGVATGLVNTYSVTSLTWASTNGGQVAVVLAAGSLVIATGALVTIAGVSSNTGTGAVSAINGQHTVNTWTDNEHFTFLLPGTSAIWGTIGGTITLTYSIVPPGAKLAVLAVAGAIAYYTDDGSTPSATNGVELPAGTILPYASNFSLFQLFTVTSSGGTVDITFYGN
jgi:hypothetical protein